MKVSRGGDWVCISRGMDYHIMIEKNSLGLYDVGLIVQNSITAPNDAKAICLYENLSKDQLRVLRKSGELERIFERADQIIDDWEFCEFDLC